MSLQVVVPTAKCVNNCPFCVSKMCESDHFNQIEKNLRFFDLYRKDFIDRLLYARQSGIDTIVLTGDGEVLQNPKFLQHFPAWNETLGNDRFTKIELQTTGVLLMMKCFALCEIQSDSARLRSLFLMYRQ